MVVSSFAIVWIVLLIYAIYKGEKYIVSLVIFSYIFQAAAILSWGDRVLTPSTFTCIVYILYSAFKKNGSKIQIPRELVVFGFFLFIVLFTSIIASVLFVGTEYIAATDAVVKLKYKGSISWFSILELFVQYFSLLLICNAKVIKMDDLNKVLSITIIIVAVVGVIQYASLLRYIPQDNFILKMLYCSNENIAYNSLVVRGTVYYNILSLRMHSTFIEPSYFGGYVSVVLLIYLHMTEKKINIVKCILLSIMGILSFSVTAYVGMLLAFVVKVIFENRKSTLYKNIVSYILLFLCALLLVKELGIINVLNNRIFNKLDSFSANIRNIWNKSAMEVFFSTYGFGLGHKFRGSSMFFTLIGAYGLFGGITYILFVVEIIYDLWINRKMIQLRVCYLGLLLIIVLQFISIGILNYCMFWMTLQILFIVKGISYGESSSNNCYTTLL